MSKLSFEDWLVLVQRAFTDAGWDPDYVKRCGSESWRDFYDDGFAPSEVFDEELYAAAS